MNYLKLGRDNGLVWLFGSVSHLKKLFKRVGGVFKMAEEDIKPHVTYNELTKIIQDVYGLKGAGESLTQLPGYDDLNYYFRPRFSCNPFIKTIWSYGYVLKILNSLDSRKDDFCEAQNAMMFFLRERDICSPIPVPTTKQDYFVKKTFCKTRKTHIVRLLEFQPGVVLKKEKKSHSLLYKLGMFLGKLNEALKEFSHPFYESHSSIWHLISVPELSPMTQVVEIPEKKQLVDEILKKFTKDVLSKVETFEKGMIHGDFNEHNVIINKGPTGESKVFAILDFGDSHYSCYLFEVAVALCYMMLECKGENMDPVVGAGHFLAGYMTIRPNFTMNFGLLKLCICARLCQSLVLGLRAFSVHPENHYVMDSQEKGWPLLKELWEISDEKLAQDWFSIIQFYKNFHQ